MHLNLFVQVDSFFVLASMAFFIRPRFSHSLRCFARAVLLLPVGEINFFEGRSSPQSAIDSTQTRR